MDKKETYFVDIDGTIFKYRKFETYETSAAEVVGSTLKYLLKKKADGHMIVLTTARPDWLYTHTVNELKVNNVPFDRLVMGIERGPRYLINDMDPNKPGERAIAINIERECGIQNK
jgi:uncharacterized HAD superfamily protein